jgi:hypothetical protein
MFAFVCFTIQHGRAHKAGAKGLITYMDPQKYAKEGMDKVYPEYNWLPSNAVQRGTLKYSSVRGDPLTPGYPAVGKTIEISTILFHFTDYIINSTKYVRTGVQCRVLSYNCTNDVTQLLDHLRSFAQPFFFDYYDIIA